MTESVVDIAKTYNKTIKKIINKLSLGLPNDPMIETIMRKYQLSIITDRTLLITESGPALYEYREMISNNLWEDLIKKDWEGTVSSVDLPDANMSKSIQTLIQTIRKLWDQYDDAEKNKICTYIKILLSQYCKYITINRA